MCGRISLFVPPDVIAERFDAEPTQDLEPRYNVTPGQRHAVVRNDSPDQIRFPTWGLVPEWADDTPSSGHVNARAETLATKPSFRDAYAERRCLVLVDGFYDWTDTPTGRQPYRFEFDDAPVALAGLWEPWDGAGASDGENDVLTDGGDAVTDRGAAPDATFTVVTTEPNDVVEPVHHRMPVVLDADEEQRWLDGPGGDESGDESDDFRDLLDPSHGDAMTSYPVSDALNDPANDSPSVIEEVAAEEDVQTDFSEFT